MVSIVLPPERHESYWQPGPSHGYMSTVLTPQNCPSTTLAVAVQGIDPGGKIRPHAHANMDEVLVLLDGNGTFLVDHQPFPAVPGTVCWVGRYVLHELRNEGAGQMKVLALLLPPGAELAWRAMGRPRRFGDTPPPPYGREGIPDLITILEDAGFASAEEIANPPPGTKGVGLVVGPDEGAAFWQPKPTGGHVTVKLSRANLPANMMALGTQIVPPGGIRPPRRSGRSDLVLFVTAGSGRVVVDGREDRLVPDTLVYVGRDSWVGFQADADQPLELIWTEVPPPAGELLDVRLGRPVKAGETPPDFDPPPNALRLAMRQSVELA